MEKREEAVKNKQGKRKEQGAPRRDKENTVSRKIDWSGW
jgi:hypothetical protein